MQVLTLENQVSQVYSQFGSYKAMLRPIGVDSLAFD